MNSPDIIAALSHARRVAVLPHVGIDADALCAALAIQKIIENYGGKAVVFAEENVPRSLDFIGGKTFIWDKTDFDFDVAVAVDCGDKARLGERTPLFDATALKINIDHHGTNTNFGDLNMVEPDSPATCQLIYDMIDFPLTKELAQLIMTGIITDTGGFRFSSTCAHTHETAAALIRAGANSSHICEQFFDNKSFAQLKIESAVMSAVELYHGGKTAAGYATDQMFEEAGATTDDAQAISGILRQIEGVSTSIFAYHKNGEVKLSLRTDGIVNAAEVCSLLGGGGHIRAAGATMQGDIKDCVKKALEAVEKYY